MSAKNIALGTLLGMSVASSGAALAASADNFKGFNLSLGVKAESSTFNTHETGAGTWQGSGSTSAHSGSFSYDRQIEWPNSAAKFGAEMNLGYNFKMGDNFLLGLSLSGDFIKLLSGKTQSTNNHHITCDSHSGSSSALCVSGGGGGGGGGSDTNANLTLRDSSTGQIALQNHYGFVVRPMFAVTDQTAIYLKGSYNQAKSNGFGPAVTMRGPGFGVGFETNLSESWFLRAELEQIRYSGDQGDHSATIDVNSTPANTSYNNGKLTVDAKVTSGLIAIGLRF